MTCKHYTINNGNKKKTVFYKKNSTEYFHWKLKRESDIRTKFILIK